ncbi:MAG: HYR domain-containing protein [Saprospiraceae bacterium]|nr:HYR domain-containing protein [Saprospiraceae bacterium]
MVPLSQTCGAPYGPGCFFPIGCTSLCYEARDASGNIGRCEFEVCVNPYPNPITELACNDEIQISLDDSCLATINPDMVLEGGPYSCYDDYIVTVRRLEHQCPYSTDCQIDLAFNWIVVTSADTYASPSQILAPVTAVGARLLWKIN